MNLKRIIFLTFIALGLNHETHGQNCLESTSSELFLNAKATDSTIVNISEINEEERSRLFRFWRDLDIKKELILDSINCWPTQNVLSFVVHPNGDIRNFHICSKLGLCESDQVEKESTYIKKRMQHAFDIAYAKTANQRVSYPSLYFIIIPLLLEPEIK